MQSDAKARTARRAHWWWAIAALWLVNLVSALVVVGVTQQVRQDIGQLEQLRRESAELEVQWGQYLLERSTLASYARVEKKAREQLNMKVPEPGDIILIDEEP